MQNNNNKIYEIQFPKWNFYLRLLFYRFFDSFRMLRQKMDERTNKRKEFQILIFLLSNSEQKIISTFAIAIAQRNIHRYKEKRKINYYFW